MIERTRDSGLLSRALVRVICSDSGNIDHDHVVDESALRALEQQRRAQDHVVSESAAFSCCSDTLAIRGASGPPAIRARADRQTRSGAARAIETAIGGDHLTAEVLG
jgi:hypothetical protein